MHNGGHSEASARLNKFARIWFANYRTEIVTRCNAIPLLWVLGWMVAPTCSKFLMKSAHVGQHGCATFGPDVHSDAWKANLFRIFLHVVFNAFVFCTCPLTHFMISCRWSYSSFFTYVFYDVLGNWVSRPITWAVELVQPEARLGERGRQRPVPYSFCWNCFCQLASTSMKMIWKSGRLLMYCTFSTSFRIPQKVTAPDWGEVCGADSGADIAASKHKFTCQVSLFLAVCAS